jgi:hypothetical protein
MKAVKQICLSVAMAGIVAGAGSAVSTAVASADPAAPDSTRSAGTSENETPDRAASPSNTRTRGQVSRPAAAQAAKNSDRPGASVATPSAPERMAPGSATPARSEISTPQRRRTVSLPDRTPAPSPDAISAPARDAATTTPPPAVRPIVTAAAPGAVVPATPAPAPVPVPVLPVPAAPVAPASAVTVSSSVSASRSRSASAVASQIGDPPPTHVLLIGTDGTNLDKVLADPANVGFFDLMAESVTGATSIVGHTTISGPSWTTILTGVWDNKSGVINNIFNPAPYDAWPTVFNLLEAHNPDIDTAVIADWKYINDIGAAGAYPVAADDNVFVPFDTSWEDTDDDVTTATIARINATQAAGSSFIFSYQVAVDEAGHAYGGGSPEYAAAIVNTSENIAAIMAAVDAWETANPGEEWTVIVTTDHGHQQSVGFGHGFQSPNETSSFVIFDLEGDEANDGKQNLGYSNADITPTIVNLFGAPPRSDFDGVSLATKTDSIVDPVDLSQALNDAVDTFGYPNIGTDVALGIRTIFGSIPYFLDGFVTTITGQLQSIVEQDIFLVSALAGAAEFLVQITGDVLVFTTQAIARVVAYLTGAGTIPPTDPPLTPPPADSVLVPVWLPAAVLV